MAAVPLPWWTSLETAQKAIDSQQKLLDHLVTAQSAPAAAPAQSAVAPPAEPATPSVEVDNKGRPFSPLAFHIGGADFTPGGFMDFFTVLRSDLGGPAGGAGHTVRRGRQQGAALFAARLPHRRCGFHSRRFYGFFHGLAIRRHRERRRDFLRRRSVQ